MSKIICAINMTLDGYFDHSIALPDEHVHEHYRDLLKKGDLILYGRKTYEMMEYWRHILFQENVSNSELEFAKAIDGIPKIVFSTQLESLDWSSAKLASENLIHTVKRLKQSNHNIIYIGSKSLMIQLLEAKLLDELQLCIHPVANGEGRNLFEGLKTRVVFKQKSVITLKGGHTILTLSPIYA